MRILKNEQGCVLRCDDDVWAAALAAARQNGWTGIDETANELSAGDAETLAEALEEAGGDVAELIDFCGQGAVFIQ
jgi:hypothetical protein